MDLVDAVRQAEDVLNAYARLSGRERMDAGMQTSVAVAALENLLRAIRITHTQASRAFHEIAGEAEKFKALAKRLDEVFPAV